MRPDATEAFPEALPDPAPVVFVADRPVFLATPFFATFFATLATFFVTFFADLPADPADLDDLVDFAFFPMPRSRPFVDSVRAVPDNHRHDNNLTDQPGGFTLPPSPEYTISQWEFGIVNQIIFRLYDMLTLNPFHSIGLAALLLAMPHVAHSQEPSFTTIEFPSLDGLLITADLYRAHDDPTTPFIVLCHQAGWSRGEYREIAPRLNQMGFNCMAIDQRSGGKVNGVDNETARRAKKEGKSTAFPDAEQDIIAALKYARDQNKGKIILWGSSYSAALSLRIAGEHPDLVDAVLAFAPGEYFTRFGKPDDWIAQSAQKIEVPVFITSAKDEYPRWKSIYEAIPSRQKVKFVPSTPGNHGSRALWKKFDDSDDYWNAVTPFLESLK